MERSLIRDSVINLQQWKRENIEKKRPIRSQFRNSSGKSRVGDLGVNKFRFGTGSYRNRVGLTYWTSLKNLNRTHEDGNKFDE